MPETTRKHVSLFKDNLIRVVFILTLSIIVVGFAFLDEPQSSQGKGQSKGTQATKDVKAEKTLWEGFSSDATAVLTFGLFIVGAAQAGLFVWQLRLIRKSLIDTKRAAKAAKRQAKLARDTLIASQRAWIRVGTPPDTTVLRSGGQGLYIDISIPMWNVGQAPALDVAIEAWFDFSG